MGYPYPITVGTAQKKNIYTILAGESFVDSLAAGLLHRVKDTPEALATYRILLPTRRACRMLRESFLRQSGGKPLLLPRMQPLGDIDADELSLEMMGGGETFLNIPPSISPLQRKILLMRLILARPDFSGGIDQALRLSDALAQLLDSLHTENITLSALTTLVPDDFSEHWQITLRFLTILSESWANILTERGVIDPADRRNRLIHALTDHWTRHPPATPIVAAGSTGSIPATADLLKTISTLPHGYVVLPGLDTGLADADRDTIPETHPQFLMMQLLAHCDVTISDIMPFCGDTIRLGAENPKPVQNRQSTAKRLLVHEIMRPADSTDRWTEIKGLINETARTSIAESLKSTHLMTFDTPRQEATAIALLLRETLNTDGLTAALVTPDRALARRVASLCQRWGIALDDSAGTRLHETPIGRFFMLIAQACRTPFSPAALLSLLKHPLCQTDPKALHRFEIKLLRDKMPPRDWTSLKTRCMDTNMRVIADQIELLMTLILNQDTNELSDFTTILSDHIRLAETLSGGADKIWRGEDGEALALLLSDLRTESADLPPVDFDSYVEALENFMSAVTVRPAYGTHPRLTILGTLEARLIHADRIIIAGLNEGTFPSDPAADPWMSRPMRQKCGLPSPERSIGQAAHDFVQGFCANEVFLTRSRRVDGTPTTPARWLQRLDTVIHALDLQKTFSLENDSPYTLWADMLDAFDGNISPSPRPAPKPPVEKRPRKLSVTRIETWMRDPYAIYAERILKLDKLRDLEEEADAAERGTLMHDILDCFVKTYPDRLPDDALPQLLKIGKGIFGDRLNDPRIRTFWWERFKRIAAWFIDQEQSHRPRIQQSLTEIKGEITLSTTTPFILTAKADRIDVLRDGTAMILDYKTGTPPSTPQVLAGFAPQLPLEGAILIDGGFPDIGKIKPSALTFWRMSGGTPAGEVRHVKCDDVSKLCQDAKDGVLALVALFDNVETPYISLPRPAFAPPRAFQNYYHLARVAEWATLSDTDATP